MYNFFFINFVLITNNTIEWQILWEGLGRYYNLKLLFMSAQRPCYLKGNTGLFLSPSGTSELDCTTTKTDTTERSVSIGTESLKVFFVLGALAYLQVPPLGGSRDEKWRAQ